MLKISAVICLICLCYAHSLPHCKVIELPEGTIHRNTVNVIYTMESSCKYCARKATMLPDLKALLRSKGINAHFIVAVNKNSSRLSGLSLQLSINKRHLWEIFGEQNNHFYIIDRCGRMVYNIINPWSSLQIPFLQGAIAATQFSHPCGLCPQDYIIQLEKKVEEENLKIYPPMVEEAHSQVEEIPLGVVMRLRHKHHGDPNVYNHIVMTANGIEGYHRHLPYERDNKIEHSSKVGLNIPEDVDQAYEATSIPNETVSDSSVTEKQQSGLERSINSIKNSSNNSLRMANETQSPLGSSETKDNSLVNSAMNNTKDELLVSRISSDVNIEINSTNSEKSQEVDHSRETTLQELDSAYTEVTTEIYDTYEDVSSNDYDERSEESESADENSQVNSNELAEIKNLKEHYRRIIDWIKYDY